MLTALWIFLSLILAFSLSYILETWWMIGWATYIVAKARILFQRLAK